MTRIARSDLGDDGVFHVTARGNAGMEIFTDDVERKTFLKLLEDVATANDWTLYAYCLMPNHYHLVVEATRAALSRGMTRLNGAYAHFFNQRHKRYGHLFQGRYGARPVDETRRRDVRAYVLENPERAGLGPNYPWAALLIPD